MTSRKENSSLRTTTLSQELALLFGKGSCLVAQCYERFGFVYEARWVKTTTDLEWS